MLNLKTRFIISVPAAIRREPIFASDKDYLRFEALLGQSVDRYQVELHAYVLLPNHFHLLARTQSQSQGGNGVVSKDSRFVSMGGVAR